LIADISSWVRAPYTSKLHLLTTFQVPISIISTTKISQTSTIPTTASATTYPPPKMFDPTSHLTTPRLTISHLDPSNPSQCTFLVSLWNTHEFISMLGGKPTSVINPSAAKSLITNRFAAEHARNGYGIYLISLTEDATPIGTVSLMRGEKSPLLAPDIGFALLSEYMRKGYAVEAAQAIIKYADEALGVKAIFGFCDGGNQASMGVLGKLGMRWEGMRRVGVFRGRETGVWSWGMERVEDWGLCEGEVNGND
jgi:RimJ/RimL family protein N-acetyltransferase